MVAAGQRMDENIEEASPTHRRTGGASGAARDRAIAENRQRSVSGTVPDTPEALNARLLARIAELERQIAELLGDFFATAPPALPRSWPGSWRKRASMS